MQPEWYAEASQGLDGGGESHALVTRRPRVTISSVVEVMEECPGASRPRPWAHGGSVCTGRRWGGPGRFSTAIHVRVWVGVAALRGCEGLARPFATVADRGW